MVLTYVAFLTRTSRREAARQIIGAILGARTGEILIRDFAAEMRSLEKSMAPALEAGRPASASGSSSNQCKGRTGRTPKLLRKSGDAIGTNEHSDAQYTQYVVVRKGAEYTDILQSLCSQWT